MENNPFAYIFLKAFEKINQENNPTLTQKTSPETEEKILSRFEKHFNHFLNRCFPEEQLQIDIKKQNVTARQVIKFSYSLRAIMLNCSTFIPEISSKDSLDPDVISLFDNLSELAVRCNRHLDTIYDYNVFELKNAPTPHFSEAKHASPDNKNIYIFGANRTNIDTPDIAFNNFNHYMKDIAKLSAFQQENVQLRCVCFPTSYPEEIAVPEILGTIKEPENYNVSDYLFAINHWKDFLGEDIQTNEDGDIISGKAHSPKKFIENMKNLTILSYCAGAANAHRCLKAFKHIANQWYSKEDVATAMKNVNFISYAFLPLEKNPDYRHTAVICSSKDESNPENVLRCNFPEKYEQFRLKKTDTGNTKLTPYTEQDSIISLELPSIPVIYDDNHHPISKDINNRNGHRWQNVTARNDSSPNFSIYSGLIKLALDYKLTQKNIKKLLSPTPPQKSNGR